MSKYSEKLQALAEKEQQLAKQKQALLEERKKEIGDLAEKMQLLTVSDSVLAGVFLELEQALTDDADKVKQWDTDGNRFLKPKRHKQEA